MKKLITILVLLLCLNVSAEAKTIKEATAEAVSFFQVQPDLTEAYKKCKNYRSIDKADIPLVSDAIGAGILMPKDNILDLSSEDLTPLINGITSYGIKSGCKVVTGALTNMEIDRAPVTDKTFILQELERGKEYTALIKENKCVAVLPLGDLKRPVLYRARVFVADGGMIAFDSVVRYSIGKWLDSGLNGRLLIGEMHGFSIPDEVINENYMDKIVYIYADAYEPVIKIHSMRLQ